jgi:hypothetical protein
MSKFKVAVFNCENDTHVAAAYNELDLFVQHNLTSMIGLNAYAAMKFQHQFPFVKTIAKTYPQIETFAIEGHRSADFCATVAGGYHLAFIT